MITTPMMPCDESVMLQRRALMQQELARLINQSSLRSASVVSPSSTFLQHTDTQNFTLFPITPRSTFLIPLPKKQGEEYSRITNTYPSIPNLFSLYRNMSDHLHMYQASMLWYHMWDVQTSMSSSTQRLANTRTQLELQSSQSQPQSNSSLPTIGFLCANLYVHSTGKAVVGLIVELSKIFNVVVFLTKTPRTDDIIYRHIVEMGHQVKIVDLSPLQTLGGSHLSLSKSDVDATSAGMMEHYVDILVHVDVGVDPMTYLLALTRRHAPIQIAFWANPITTGMRWSMDYFVVGEQHRLAQSTASQKFVEQVIQLSGFGTYYYRPSSSLSSSSVEEALQISDVTLASLLQQLDRGGTSIRSSNEKFPLLVSVQSLVKMHPSFDRALRRLLVHHLPTAHIILLAGRGPVWSYQLKRRLARLAVKHHDIMSNNTNTNTNTNTTNNNNNNDTQQQSGPLSSWLDRVHILPRLPASDYSTLLKEADVLLDSFPYSGFTTSIEALALGRPIVTLDTGTVLYGSQTAALYRTMQCPLLEEYCVATNIDEWISKIVNLSIDVDYRRIVREKVQACSSDLFEDQQAIRSWSSFLMRVHQTHLA